MVIRVLVVDDHAVVRQGVVHILEEMEGAVIDEAETGDDAMRRIRRDPYDAVILDITLPGRSGIEVLQDIKAERPALPVLILSMHPEDQMAIRVLKAGAAGYLMKDSAPDRLVDALKTVLGGGRYITPAAAQHLVLDLQAADSAPPHEQLSGREYEVFRMIARGRTVSEIATDLSISVKTVSTYRTRILEKMRLSNNAELIRYAVTHGLTE